jgi:hypothetical protein
MAMHRSQHTVEYEPMECEVQNIDGTVKEEDMEEDG